MVAMLERKTTLAVLAIGSMATMVVYAIETLTAANTPLDRWIQPVLALVLFGLFLRLRHKPETLLGTQRLAVACLQFYFCAGVIHLCVFDPAHISTYWVATTYMWTILITLLLHITWPQRAALVWSLILVAVVSVPPVIVRWQIGPERWNDEFAPLILNSLMVETAVLLSLLSVSRLRHGVMQILSTGGPIGPSDARDALEHWLHEKTTALADARDTAEAASRAKSQFLAVMSHELRTPLHAMLVSADLLGERTDGPLPEREGRLVRTIQNSGKHLLALIDQVLDLSRIEAGKVLVVHEPMDLSVVCRRATEAVLPMTQRNGLALALNMPPTLPRLRRGDALRLTQILINLLANASKFTERGSITLTVSAGDGDQVRFDVTDTGPGLSEDAQRRVFEAFYQADRDSTRRHGGVGLGLTITRDLVALMSGQLALSSQLGQGTTVTVTIPLPVCDQPVVRTRPDPPLARDITGARVLVVEDDPVNSMLACEVLNGVHAHAVAVDSGEAALHHLAHHPVDIVLMDFRMPGMDGLEVTRRIRRGEAGAQAVSLPIVGLTANAYLEDRQQCLDAGMSDVLTKPIERRQLIEAVAQWRRGPSPLPSPAATP